MAKKKYVVDVFMTVAQSIVVEADTKEEAEKVAESKMEDGSIYWDIHEHLTDDYELEVCGEEDENGNRNYY